MINDFMYRILWTSFINREYFEIKRASLNFLELRRDLFNHKEQVLGQLKLDKTKHCLNDISSPPRLALVAELLQDTGTKGENQRRNQGRAAECLRGHERFFEPELQGPIRI